MKYGTWNIGTADGRAVEQLLAGGFSPLTARVLASRGCTDCASAQRMLDYEDTLTDPFLLKEMDAAVARLRLALARGERIAVYGDYDVDGITATCLLTDFLSRQGADCLWYIPDRIGEGYGLNTEAVRKLHAAGAALIVTVDCGITAVDEARLCQALGVDLIITDHHECKPELPPAVAVIDPHRPDATYPHRDLSGVGVAFKLACAMGGAAEPVLERYSDLVCLGTVADVMPLRGENRLLVSRGLASMQRCERLGLAALIEECGIDSRTVSTSTVGYTLAPRINAAGRLAQVRLAVELLCAQERTLASQLAAELCELNRRRQRIESEIYAQAVAMLPTNALPKAIVLAREHWHQGVVGIVASRLADEYNCPVFLICLDGAVGKASSRSYGGFNLFACLSRLAPLLEGYGGHELAAGFTIRRENIKAFAEQVCRMVSAHPADSGALRADCVLTPDLLTLENVAGLDELEPCGEGCPQAVFCLEQLRVEQIAVFAGRHLRLRLQPEQGPAFSAVFFSMSASRAGIWQGDLVDIAFTPQIKVYRGAHSVQINLLDIRPCRSERQAIAAHRTLYHRRLTPTAVEAAQLLPERAEFAAVWRYLDHYQQAGTLTENFECLCRKIVRGGGAVHSMARIRICLDVFDEMGLIELEQQPGLLCIRMTAQGKKVDLNNSAILRHLRGCKQEEPHGSLSGPL